MDGFINIVKYKQSEFDINEGFDLEQLILLKRENNLQFENKGDPVTKFVYFDTSLKEYNMIYLYNNESDMISQHTDYLTQCSLNFNLGKNPSPVSVNGNDVVYTCSLLNVQKPHSVQNGYDERILFKISIYSDTYESYLKKLKEIK